MSYLGAELLGCADGPLEPVRSADWDGSPVVTDSLEYTLRRVSGGYEAFVTATYRNRTQNSVHYARCNSGSEGPMYGVLRADGDTTRHVIGVAWACVGGVDTGSVLPGETIQVRVWIGSTDSPYANPPRTMEMRIGLFRVALEFCRSAESDSDDCELSPMTERMSNPFWILPPE